MQGPLRLDGNETSSGKDFVSEILYGIMIEMSAAQTEVCSASG